MRTILGVVAALFILVGNTLANGVPVRTRSSYGQTQSTILANGSTSANGVTIASEEFCSDANTDPTTGTCQLGFAFQITSTLPANAQSLTLTLPVPLGGTLLSAGLLTNDDVPQPGNSFNLFSSPFSQSEVLGLSPSAILFGNASGNPFFTFALPFPLTGGGTGLSLFLDVSDNNSIHNDGTYCYKPGTSGGCTAADFPSIPTVGINLQQATAAPEPASLSLLASGLLGLGLLRRRRKSS